MGSFHEVKNHNRPPSSCRERHVIESPRRRPQHPGSSGLTTLSTDPESTASNPRADNCTPRAASLTLEALKVVTASTPDPAGLPTEPRAHGQPRPPRHRPDRDRYHVRFPTGTDPRQWR